MKHVVSKSQIPWNLAVFATLGLFSLFFLHRLFTLEILNLRQNWTALDHLDHLIVGLLSDLWIAGIGGSALLLVQFVLRKPLLQKISYALWLLFFGTLTVMHQIYVEFFKMPVLPFHFQYLADTAFVSAHGVPEFSIASITLVVFLVGIIWLGVVFSKNSLGVLSYRPTIVILFAWGLAAHILNIEWRVQHFIQPHLQVNVFERLYAITIKTKRLKVIETEEIVALLKELKPNRAVVGTNKTDLLQSLLFWNLSSDATDRVAKEFKTHFLNLQSQKIVPIITFVVLESARPSEFGAYANALEKKTLTPVFDQYAAKGVLFKNAYTTGTVTRSGQEAIFCGFISGMSQSLMRERSDIQWPCLSQVLAGSAQFFWFHGGDPNFDNQMAFWQRKNINHILSRSDFPEDSGLGWGISDRTLLMESAERLATYAKNPLPAVGQILTVNNHIPWRLPDDHSFSKKEVKTISKRHLSYATTAYVDQSLGAFFDALKAKNLWKQSLIIVISDHGSKVAPYRKLYQSHASEIQQAKLMSHAVMLMTGGITEHVIQKHPAAKQINNPVSQVDIPAFVGYLFGKDQHTYLGERLFTNPRRMPILVKLESSLYLPEFELLFDKDDFNDTTFMNSRTKQQLQALRYFQAYETFLETKP